MSEKNLQFFLEEDLAKYFEKYCASKPVQRYLRNNGVNRVKDLLVLPRIDFEEFLSRTNDSIRKISLLLYDELSKRHNKILQSNETKHKETQPGNSSVAQDISSTPQDAQVAETSITTDPSRQDSDAPSYVEAKKIDAPTQQIHLGFIIQRDGFGILQKNNIQMLPADEDGLRRHVLIAGATGSGKTVAARYIIEQAAINNIPSIVIDAQGDISSLVIQFASSDQKTIYERAAELTNPVSDRDREDLKGRVEKHSTDLNKHPGAIYQYYASKCVPRIFTPGRPDLGLPLSLPPFVDILGSYANRSAEEFTEEELDELLRDEVRNLVRVLFPHIRHDLGMDYVELLTRLFRHASSQGLFLEGRTGIRNFVRLCESAKELEGNFIQRQLPPADFQKFIRALNRLEFGEHEKWFSGFPLHIDEIVRPRSDGRTPINIINVQELQNSDDKKRVLRNVIMAVYKYGLQHPRQSGPPSLIFYIDEIGSGYGERSVAKPDRETPYRVYEVLGRLVRQARKYGVSVILASQKYTDFEPVIRQQLGTKIIGRIDDRSEQRRVIDCIRTDYSNTGCDQEMIGQQLPGLAPPIMLYIGVKGHAVTYEQLKCCSLDLTIRGEAIRRWHEVHEGFIQSRISSASDLYRLQRLEEALEILIGIEDDARYHDDLLSSSAVMRARCLIALGQIEDACNLLFTHTEEKPVGRWIDVVRDVVSLLADTPNRSIYKQVLERGIDIAKSINDAKSAEEFEVSLSRTLLFDELNPDAAQTHLTSVSQSGDEKVRLFASTWSKIVGLFKGWGDVWSFFSRKAKEPIRLFEASNNPFSVIETQAPNSPSAVSEPREHTTALVENPCILSLVRKAELANDQYHSGIALEEFKKIQIDQQRTTEALIEHRKSGHVEDAVSEISRYFAQARGPVYSRLKTELQLLESDIAIRKVLIKNWLNDLGWRELEIEVSHLFIRMGYKAWATKPSGDGGIDVRAIRGNDTCVIQCKHYKGRKVGLDVVQAIHAARSAEKATKAIVVTTSELEPGAKQWAQRSSVDVIEGPQLVELFNTYYDSVAIRSNASNIDRACEQAELPKDDDVTAEEKVNRTKSCEEKAAINEFLQKNERIRNSDLQSLLAIDSRQATVVLKQMVENGILVQHGERRGAYYTKGKVEHQPSERKSLIPSATCYSTEKRTPSRLSVQIGTVVEGTVAHIREGYPYGNIKDDVGRSWFFHRNGMVRLSDWPKIGPGKRVCFKVGLNDKGPCAVNIELL